MTDEIDQAQPFEQARLDNTIARFARGLRRQGSEFCIDCGDPIPEARRKANPNANRCIGCQEIFEGNT